jgi:hypothetical protein
MKLDFLHREITPKSWNKHIVVYSGAVTGGIVFGVSASWAWAILCDLVTVLCVWSILKFVGAI